MKSLRKMILKIFSIKISIHRNYEDMRRSKKITEYKIFGRPYKTKVEPATRVDVLKSFNISPTDDQENNIREVFSFLRYRQSPSTSWSNRNGILTSDQE